MIALANKEQGYTVSDQEDVEALTTAFMESLNRRRAEKKVTELNEELNRHVRRVEAANKELEAFSYSISHDLRAPVRHISSYLELFDKQNPATLDAKSRHYLQVISGAAQRMGLLIDDLLAFSRLGRAEMIKTRVDLDHLVKEVIQELMAELPGREIEWHLEPLPIAVGDRAMLRMVLVNLMANALKFCRSCPRTRIEIGAITDHPDELVCYVRDNGVGFDMRYQDKLFGLFQRLHAQEEFEGTGVGLANVQRIILRHGGRVWAEGGLGQGATSGSRCPKKRRRKQ